MDQAAQHPDVLGYRRHFTDADAFGHAILGSELDYMAMPGEYYAATHTVLKLGSLVVQHVEDEPHIVRGAMVNDVMALLLLLLLRAPHAAPLVNGVESGCGDVALVPGGVEFVCSASTAQSWAALTITRERLAELAEVSPLPLRSDGSVQILRLPRASAAALMAELRSTVTLIDHDALARPGCAQSLAASMSDLLAEALTADAALRQAPRATAAALQVVSGAQAFLEANITRPVYTEELCGALSVSPRRLHDAFKAAFGISPHRFIRARRLALARRALKQAQPRPGLVKSVGLLHGFWHLGRFAQDYRDQFGETPSETLAGAHGGRIPAPA